MSDLAKTAESIHGQVCRMFGVDPDNVPGMAIGRPSDWVYLTEVYKWLKAGWEPEWILEVLRAASSQPYCPKPPKKITYCTAILREQAKLAAELPKAPTKIERTPAEQREQLVNAAYFYLHVSRTWNREGPRPDEPGFPADILAEVRAKYDAKFKARRTA